MGAKSTIIAGILLSAACSQARVHDWEWYVSMYGGWSQTSSGDVNGTATQSTYTYTNPTAVVVEYPVNSSYNSDESFLIGMRSGIWLPVAESRLGLAGDISFSLIDSGSDDTEIMLVPLSALLLYRFPLIVSDEFPHGRLQPYLGVGLVGVSGQISTRVDRGDGSTFTAEALTSAVGGSAHAGWAWCFDQHWATFFEYRYLYSEGLSGADDDSSATPIFPDEGPVTDTHTDFEGSAISMHQIVCGFIYTF